MFQVYYGRYTGHSDTSREATPATQFGGRSGHLHALAYHGMYTEGNWPGQRHRFFRKLPIKDWVALYGPSYWRSSDYIQTYPQAFDRSTRTLATVGNLLEECAELLQRTTTWHMRATGSIIPATLRDLGGKGRFCARLQRALLAQPRPVFLPGELAGAALDQFHDALIQAGIINEQSQLVCDLDSPLVLEALRKALGQSMTRSPGFEPLSNVKMEQAVSGMVSALRQADMRSLWKALSARKRLAYAVGATLSTGTQVGINLLLLTASSSLLASVVGKTMAVAALLYGASFLVRVLTTVHARAFRTHKRHRPDEPTTYRSLSEHAMYGARRLRNRLYDRLGVRFTALHARKINVDGLMLTRQEYNSASFAWHGRAGLASKEERRAAMFLVEGTQRMTDLVYSADTVLSKLLGRFIRSGYCSWRDYRQLAGWSAGSRCAYDWQTADHRRQSMGRLRLSMARLIGVGGADVLGASLACFLVSGFWTLVSKASGGLGTVAVIGGAPAIVPVASSVVGAVGWSVSLLGEAALRLMRHHGCATTRRVGERGTSESVTSPKREGRRVSATERLMSAQAG